MELVGSETYYTDEFVYELQTLGLYRWCVIRITSRILWDIQMEEFLQEYVMYDTQGTFESI